jgi:hypothetical protein
MVAAAGLRFARLPLSRIAPVVTMGIEPAMLAV